MILAVQKVNFLLYFLQKMLVGLFQYLLQKQNLEWMVMYILQMVRQCIVNRMENC